MKATRGGFRTLQKEQRMVEVREDSYRDDGKLADATTCPKCGAVYHQGRWTWGAAAAQAPRHECPACQRIDDGLPAGYVALGGAFLAAHRAEILALVAAREARAKAEHPLQRIIAVEPAADGSVLVTTTDGHLARGIAEAVHEAYKGELDIQFSKAENCVRASWKR